MTPAIFKRWVESPGTSRTKLVATIPPHTGMSSLPERAMLAFEDGRKEPHNKEGMLSVSCSAIFFRRGVPATQDEIPSLVIEHLKLDILPMLNTLGQLGCSMHAGLTDGFVGMLFEFYEKVDPSLMQPVLKQRIFTLDDEQHPTHYIGHVCAACGTVRAQHQCPCREGVYYCGKACQNAHWKHHKTLCKHHRTTSQKKTHK